MAAPSADCWREQSHGSDSSDNDHDDVSGGKISAERRHRQEERFSHSKRQQQASKNIKYDHPIYQEISRENGLINKMDIDELSRKLKQCGLNSRGNQQVMQRRLKSWNRTKKLKEVKIKTENEYKIDYYVIIDFEATCEKENPPGFIHEIIEFPAVLMDARKKTVISEFHSYCRPVENKILTQFCTSLTGITQTMVDSAPLFPTVLRRFDEWLNRELQSTDLFAILTDGPWDVSRFLRGQCKLSKVDLPHYFKTWVNIRKHFGNYYKVQRANLDEMLGILGMDFEGRPHSGIDDARNIARIASQLLKDGCILKINDSLQ